MEGWQEELLKVVDSIAEEVDRFFQEVAKEVNEAADAWIAFSEDVADQIQTAIASDVDEFEQHIDDWLEPFLLTLAGIETAIGQAVEPVTHTVEPLLNQHPACVGCRHYHGQVYGGNVLICGMHPYGWDTDSCPDWESTWKEPS